MPTLPSSERVPGHLPSEGQAKIQSSARLMTSARPHIRGFTTVALLKAQFPAARCFPFIFGFVPSTRAEDGDPLDVLVLMYAPVFPGCIVPSRLTGVIVAERTEAGERSETIDFSPLRPTPQRIVESTSWAI